MSRKTRKLIWSAPLVAALAVVGALALFMSLSPGAASATHEEIPGPVTGLEATAKSRTSIELTWMTPAADTGGAPTGYRIDYSDDNRVWTRLVENTMSAQTSHMITEDVDSSTRRHYRVFAINSSGTGPISKDPVTAFVSVGQTFPPEAPGSFTLTVTPDGPNQINLSWTEPTENGSKVTGYIVEEMLADESDAAAPYTACDANSNQMKNGCLYNSAADQMKKRTAEHKNLYAGTTHYYRVTAVSDAGNTVSNVVGATTAGLTAPAAPTGLVAVPVQGTNADIELYWIEPTSNGGHALGKPEIQQQMRADSTAPWPAEWSDSSGGTDGMEADAFDYRLNNVSDGQYRFRVRAVQNGMDASSKAMPGYDLKSPWTYSNTVTSPADDPVDDETVVPLQPILTAAALDATTVDGEGIRLTWEKSKGSDDMRDPGKNLSNPVNDDGPTPSDYRIDRSEDGLKWMVGQTRTVSIAQWEDFEPEAGDLRHYRILPINGNVFGQANYATATATAANVSAADLLLNLTATGISTTEIRLDWSTPSGAASYDIHRADVDMMTGIPVTTGTGAWASIKMGQAGNTYTDSKGLNPGDSKWYRVVAKNSKGVAIPNTGGAEAKGMTLEAGMPAMPVDLVVESAADSSFQITSKRGTLLLWNEPVDTGMDPHNSYQIQRKVNDGAWETIVEDTMSMSTHYNDQEEPADDEMRVYRVLARSGTGTSMPSNEATFPKVPHSHNTDPMAVGMISAVSVMAGATTSAMDVSGYFSDADGDTLTYSSMSSDATIAEATVSGSMVTIEGMMEGSATITVTASDGMGGTDAMQTIMVTVTPANMAPMAVGSISDVTMRVGDDPVAMDVSGYFSDADGDTLTYTAMSDMEMYATASAEGSMVTITGVAAGSATVTVTADDGNGGMATQTIMVTVAYARVAPSNVIINPVGSGLVNVQWTPVPGAHGYYIVAAEASVGGDVHSEAVNGQDVSLGSIGGLTPGVDYLIFIGAFFTVDDYVLEYVETVTAE